MKKMKHSKKQEDDQKQRQEESERTKTAWLAKRTSVQNEVITYALSLDWSVKIVNYCESSIKNQP